MKNRFLPYKESLLLAFLITIIWFYIWGNGGISFLHDPLPNWRSGDLPAELAGYKAFVHGDLIPLLPRFISQLNAPFKANWNDFIAQDMSYLIPGLFAKFFGFYEGLNLSLLSIHLLSGLIFYGIGRVLDYKKVYCFAGGLIFAFAPLIFFRGLGHTTISTIWHIPLMLFTLIWINSPEKVFISSKNAWAICILTCILAGIFSAYYAALFVLFLGFNWIIRLLSGDRFSFKIALLIWLVLIVEVVQRSNYFYFRFIEGVNYEVLVRSLSTLGSVSLTLPDLIFSPAHQVFISEDFLPFSKNYYENIPFFFKSESQLAYIGLIPVFALCFLIYRTSLLIISKKSNEISSWFWLALGVFVFSITGGINYLIGVFGFILLRSNNRFSIFLMCIGLYYLCEVLSKKKVTLLTWIFALAISLFSIWDQVPTSYSQVEYLGQGALNASESVKKFTQQLESKLPDGAMVFQLPVREFPESGSREKMGDYDHFLPFLYSNSLHFSYGSMKGREDSSWQAHVEKLPVGKMIDKLEQYGFSALTINTDAYPNEATDIIGKIVSLGYVKTTSEGNLIAFELNPKPHPISPAPEWELHFGQTFSKPSLTDNEISRWSSGDKANLEVKRPWYIRHSPDSKNYVSRELRLQFSANSSCHVDVKSPDQEVKTLMLKANQVSILSLYPNLEGWTSYEILNNCPSSSVGSFRIIEPFIR